MTSNRAPLRTVLIVLAVGLFMPFSGDASAHRLARDSSANPLRERLPRSDDLHTWLQAGEGPISLHGIASPNPPRGVARAFDVGDPGSPVLLFELFPMMSSPRCSPRRQASRSSGRP